MSKGRKELFDKKRKQYRGSLEHYKIEFFGGNYETNKLAYELLTKEYNKRQRQIAKINVNL